MTPIRHLFGGAARGATSIAFTFIGVVVLGLAPPLFWIWAASQIAGEDRHLTPSLAVFVTTGILVTYWLLLLLAARLRERWVGVDERTTKLRRMSWNRSFRDAPASHEKLDPVERIFVVTAILGIVAFQLWYIFLAGSPLPNSPGP